MKYKLLVLVFLILASPLFAQESLLEEANAYFNSNDYENAKGLYLQILQKGKIDDHTNEAETAYILQMILSLY